MNQTKLILIGMILMVMGTIITLGQDQAPFPIVDDAFNVLIEEQSVTYDSPTARADVVTFYKTEMTNLGWTLTTELEGRGRAGSILVFENTSGDEVTIVLGEGPARDGQVRTVTRVTIDHPFGMLAMEDVAPDTTNEESSETSEGSAESVVESLELTRPLNIQLIFDASGSMGDVIEAEQKITAARRTIELLVQALPVDEDNLNVGFRVFGHEGDNTDASRDISCQSTELVVPMEGVDQEALMNTVNTYVPTGWTPIKLALTEAGQDFPVLENVRNVIILVSDGEETCGGNPEATAQLLAQSDANITTHVVGLGLDSITANRLAKIAVAGGGLYLNATDGQTLTGAVLGVVSEEFRLTGGTFVLPDLVMEHFSAGSGEFSGIVIQDGVIGIESFSAGSADFAGVEIDLNTGKITIEGGDAGNAIFDELEIEIPDFSIGD